MGEVLSEKVTAQKNYCYRVTDLPMKSDRALFLLFFFFGMTLATGNAYVHGPITEERGSCIAVSGKKRGRLAG